MPISLIAGGQAVYLNQDYGDGSNYFLLDILGGETAPIRAPVEDQSQRDGGLTHDFFLGGRHLTYQGLFLPPSKGTAWQIVVRRNQMEEDLRLVLESCLRADGLLSWTPSGLASRSLSVRNDMPLTVTNAETLRRSFTHGQTTLKFFTFGLYSASPTL
jgi:hypothetical protein